jgi:hypothetical protein
VVERLLQVVRVGLPPREALDTEVPTACELEVVEPEVVDDERHRRVVVVTDKREVVVLGKGLKNVCVETQRSSPGFQMFDAANGAPPLLGGVETDRIDAKFPAGVRKRVGVRVFVERPVEVPIRIRVEAVPVECVVQRGAVDRHRSPVSLYENAVGIEQQSGSWVRGPVSDDISAHRASGVRGDALADKDDGEDDDRNRRHRLSGEGVDRPE